MNPREEAIKVIEALQRRYNPDLEEMSSEFLKEFASRARKSMNFPESVETEFLDELRQARETMFSRYEEPSWFAIVSRYSAKIEKQIYGRKAMRPLKKVLFGTLDTGRINGMAIGIDNPEYCIVLLETGLFGFANLLAKGLAHSFPIKESAEGLGFSTKIEDVKERLQKNDILIFRIVDLVLSYITAGHPHAAEQYFPEEKYQGLTTIWLSAIEYFVLSHEYGHVFAGHLDGSDVPGGEEFPEIPTSWKQEFEADYVGLVTTLNVLFEEGYSPSLTYCGVELFFLGAELIERALAIFQDRPINSEGTLTHPPASLRRESMRTWLRQGVPKEEGEAAIEMADILSAVLEFVSPYVERTARNAKASGMTAHEKWKNY